MESLHIIGSRQMGGADQFYVRLVRALNESGHSVAAINRAGSPIANTLAASPVEQIHLPLANKWDLFSTWRIRRLARQRHSDIVQTYMGRATRLTRLSPRGRTVHVARLGGYYKIHGYYEHAHAWIGNTRGVCDYLIRAGLPQNQVYLIGNFVPEPQPADAAQLAGLRRSLGIPEAAWVIFTLGRFIDIKGFDDLLQAFAKLPQIIAGRPLHLVIAGAGPLALDLHRLARQLGLPERVHWPGWQTQPGPFYHLADLVVCPSRHETLGNVILEAWGHAKPVVATTTPGALELIQDEVNGLLTPCQDPARLASRLLGILKAAPSERRQLGEAGRDTLNKHHSQTAVLNRYLELYATLRKQRGD